MVTEYRIIGDDIVVREYSTVKTLNFKDFIEEYKIKNTHFKTPLLPNNCIRYEEKGSRKRYYILVPRGNYKLTMSNEKSYIVTLPNQIFTFEMEKSDNSKKDIRLYWGFNEEIDLDNRSWNVPALQNIYNNSKICMGEYTPKTDIREYVDEYIERFFTNKFNNDLSSGKFKIPEISKLQETKFVEEKLSSVELAKLWIKDASYRYMPIYIEEME